MSNGFPYEVVLAWVHRVRHYGVRADKPPDGCIIVPGIIEVKSRIVQSLPGEFILNR